jgi:ATP-dependent RNA helicase DDX10/DBP4
MLEALYKARWTSEDGLGALIISPTRELALQIFEVVRSVGSAHFSLSAGVICGGKDFKEEQESATKMAILVATPGRLLQHMEQTPGFDCAEVRVLVLDEADRLLDLGFAETLNSIISYLPSAPQRQTMLFSATQTKSVKDLARLSLHQPQYISVHEKAETATPSKLAQTYVVCKLQDKLNLLYSFIRSHLKTKTIVFVSSCKEARFIFETFRRLRPGVPLQLLHGKMKQQRRMLVYYDFVKKPACVLFATDIAARGLDFPAVDWVVQLDCPEDTQTYIHRVGRTARFKAKGHGLLVCTPSESLPMIEQLAAAKIPITQVHISPSAAVSITGKIAAEVAADSELKYLAQKAFTSYVRSVYLQTNKAVFNVSTLSMQEFAESLGLVVPPKVKISTKASMLGAEELRYESHKRKNENKALARLKQQIAQAKHSKAAHPDSDGSDALSSHDGYSSSENDSFDSDSDSDDRIIRKKPAAAGAGSSDGESVEYDLDAIPKHVSANMSTKEVAKLHAVNRDTKLIGKGGVAKDNDGFTPFQRVAMQKRAQAGALPPAAAGDLRTASDAYAKSVAIRLASSAAFDREHERGRVKAKHREERLRAKGKAEGVDEDAEEGDGDEAPETYSSSSDSPKAVESPVLKVGLKRGRRTFDASAGGDLEAQAMSLLYRKRSLMLDE